jgi:histidinol dehydrogenase
MRVAPLTLAGVTAAVRGLRPPAALDQVVTQAVAALVAAVRERGDAAVVEASRRLDWPEATASRLLVTAAELESSYAELDPELLSAFERARENISWFHSHERRPDWEEVGPSGQRLGIRYRPVGRAGLYVPGGLGSYASTVIMNAVPAEAAGVRDVFVCTPPDRDGRVNRSVLAAAHFMGIREVYRVGGAQAVAAMAFGTESIPRADVICGPGNAYVMEAKRQVYGTVGIDGLAGPSEVVVVAAAEAQPTWVAADLLAQEEHGSGASAVLVAETESFCRAVSSAVAQLRAGRPDGDDGSPEVPSSVGGLHAFFAAAGEDFEDLAAALVNAYAPEHLELHMADPRGFLAKVDSAGAVFLGALTPTAFGDYLAGTNHVLPTGGASRFSSPLSVDTFLRATSTAELPANAVRTLVPALARLAESEGFVFHRVSAELRVAEWGEQGAS